MNPPFSRWESSVVCSCGCCCPDDFRRKENRLNLIERWEIHCNQLHSPAVHNALGLVMLVFYFLLFSRKESRVVRRYRNLSQFLKIYAWLVARSNSNIFGIKPKLLIFRIPKKIIPNRSKSKLNYWSMINESTTYLNEYWCKFWYHLPIYVSNHFERKGCIFVPRIPAFEGKHILLVKCKTCINIDLLHLRMKAKPSSQSEVRHGCFIKLVYGWERFDHLTGYQLEICLP